MKKFLSANEAVAHAAAQAGCVVASAYPGTPSTEILENIAKFKDTVRCEWAVNEKVAVETAVGASMAGARALTAMKHVGLNVAMDPFMTFTYVGPLGGFVLVSADDPGTHSSQNEQDNRNLAKFARALLLEPAEQGFAWLVREQAELGAVFRVLGMPGALPCLHFLLRQKSSDLFSPQYLAKQAGAAEEETAAFLEAARDLGLCERQSIRRKGREEKLYRTIAPLPLLGLLSLGKLLLRQDEAAHRRFGCQIGSFSPLIHEKGDTP